MPSPKSLRNLPIGQRTTDELLNSYHRDERKNRNLLTSIANNLLKGDLSEQFINDEPEAYNKYIEDMQRMGLVGKLKDGKFTENEASRTFVDAKEKGLVKMSRKTQGSASGFMLSRNSEAEKPLKYMVKQGTAEEILFETIGARFYKNLSGQLGNNTAKTRLLTTKNGETNLGSRMIENFSDFFNNSTPTIRNNKVVSKDKEVKGYIAALTVAKFIQDFDALGYGPNLGMNQIPLLNKEREVYSSIKIDPGNSFNFIPRTYKEGEPLTILALGVATNITNKLHENRDFNTTIPLDFIDPNNPSELREELGALKTALKHVHPNLDTRDLLLDNMSYKKVSQNFKPYKQMAKTLEGIANTSDTELHQLVFENIPDEINGKNISATKMQIYEQLVTRREVIKELYAKEIEFAKLYRQAKVQGSEIEFSALKTQAEENIQNNPKSTRNIYVTKEFKEEIENETANILVSALTKIPVDQIKLDESLELANYIPDKELAIKMMKQMIHDNQDLSFVAPNIPDSVQKEMLKDFKSLYSQMPETYTHKTNFIASFPKELQDKIKEINPKKNLRSRRGLPENKTTDGLSLGQILAMKKEFENSIPHEETSFRTASTESTSSLSSIETSPVSKRLTPIAVNTSLMKDAAQVRNEPTRKLLSPINKGLTHQ